MREFLMVVEAFRWEISGAVSSASAISMLQAGSSFVPYAGNDSAGREFRVHTTDDVI